MATEKKPVKMAAKRAAARPKKVNKGNPTPSPMEQFAEQHDLEYSSDYLKNPTKFRFLRTEEERLNFSNEDWAKVVIGSVNGGLIASANVNRTFGPADANEILIATSGVRAILADKMKGVPADDIYISAVNIDIGLGKTEIIVLVKDGYDFLSNTLTLKCLSISRGNLYENIVKRKAADPKHIMIQDHFHAKAIISVFCPQN